MGIHTEIGPTGLSRGAIHSRARELAALARLAAELSVAGPGQDLHRAQVQFERMRAILGGGLGDDRG